MVGTQSLEPKMQVTITEAAQLLGLSEKTVRRRILSGRLQGTQRPTHNGYTYPTVMALKGQQVLILVHPCRHSLLALRPAEELDLSDRDIITEAALAVSGLVSAALQPALDVDLLPLAEVLVTALRQLPKGLAIEPLRFLPLLPRGSLVPMVADHTEGGHSLANGCISHFRVTTQVADNHDLVHVLRRSLC